MPKLPKSKKVAWQAKRKPFASNGSKPKYSDNHFVRWLPLFFTIYNVVAGLAYYACSTVSLT